MRVMSKLLALGLTAAAMQSAMAGTVFLNFEDVTATQQLTNRYASQGVTVSGSAWTATSQACTYNGVEGDIEFIRTNSCGALYLAQDPFGTASTGPRSLTISLASGFNAFSFLYAGSVESPNLQVHAYDATGRELGLGLSGLQASPCGGFVFCTWLPGTLSFQGVATTVTFTATDHTILLDDLTFTTPTTGQLPEPASIALVAGALGALGWTRKRTRG